MLVGKPFDAGEANDRPTPPMLIGPTLVVETANHLQTVALVDFYVRSGSFAFQDAAGIRQSQAQEALGKRVEDLRSKLRAWEQNPALSAADLNARRQELATLQADLKKLESPAPPTTGSFFRYQSVPIRTELGREPAMAASMATFYKRVNEHNRLAFADRQPLPPGPDGNRYVGIQTCASCHPGAKEVWDQTAHAHAYKTLADQSKQFNLDCVSCHVTGYGKPGGSTVTVNEPLQNVQCEECHGPGGLHQQQPTTKGLILANPPAENCVSACHHPPHVEGFDATAQMHRILGPGHGDKEKWVGKGSQ